MSRFNWHPLHTACMLNARCTSTVKNSLCAFCLCGGRYVRCSVQTLAVIIFNPFQSKECQLGTDGKMEDWTLLRCLSSSIERICVCIISSQIIVSWIRLPRTIAHIQNIFISAYRWEEIFHKIQQMPALPRTTHSNFFFCCCMLSSFHREKVKCISYD